VLITLPTSRPKVSHRERWGFLVSEAKFALGNTSFLLSLDLWSERLVGLFDLFILKDFRQDVF
jgi:hypothetical protein